MNQNQFPSSNWIMRILFFSCVILALLLGLYQELYRLEKKKYAQLEDNYLQLRGELGREEIQGLIDQSHEK